MNKSLRVLSRTVFAMFLVLFFSVTMIQFVQVGELNAHPLNSRTLKNSYKVERGSILVDSAPVAFSSPTGDAYRYQREYTDGKTYAPITGFFSHTQGMSGLEQAMNQDLSGAGDAQFFTRIVNTLNNVSPQGSSVETTIDPAAQEAAVNALVDGGFSGAVVALEPKTGRVLAMASTPSFNPNRLSVNNDADIIEHYRKLEADPDKPLVNRAIAGDLYHPGSVYKLVVAAAAIESGEATPSTKFDNPASLKLPQSTAVMHNSDRGTCGGQSGKATLTDALVYSCNIPIAELAMEMGNDEVPKMANAFGFDQELSIPLAVTPSASPTPIDDAQTALSSIGQLDVRATPLQIAMVSAGIANDGVVMTPYLVDSVITPDLKTEREFSPTEFSRPISGDTADDLTDMLVKGVSDSGAFAALAGIDGVEVAGKTGTAENGTDAEGNELPYTLWFTGFAPAEDPEVAVAVVIENGGGEAHGFEGGSYELPTVVGKQVMEAVLGG